MLGVLFGRNEARVLETLAFSREPLHLRELARRAGVAPIQASRILGRLSAAGLVEREAKGNMVFFFFGRGRGERRLRGFVEAARGIVPALRERLAGVRGIGTAFLYGSFASGTEGAKSDVDLLVVGDADILALSGICSELGARYGREINYSVYSRDEFERKRKAPFLSGVLKEERIMLVGNDGKIAG
ncbi:DNA polymerase subunit beta [Candidatus Micrarchaeota archaeon CG08_land_8_20_14_0_20_59_11]|nr:MAG: DNA polymerase subunit beta [Candidatus Micrarchaeota archaeon CG08_land_8_20_14_0_20_59_11]